ncbi:YhbY family RNA-binding protein [Candidatus Woesearchaeota archaeon]|nr:YhbY family RNA-binding protein [Candidatus Woesearchaeota archaeon]
MALPVDMIKRLRSRARALEPQVRIGKNGLTDNAVLQVKKLIVKRKLVKVKLLRSFLDSNDRKAAAKELAARTGSELVEQVGFVVVLYKR